MRRVHVLVIVLVVMVFVLMRVLMIVFMLVVMMSLLMRKLVRAPLHLRCSLFPVPCSLPFPFLRQHIHFGRRESAAHHLACFQPRAHAQRGRRLRHQVKRNAGIDQCAQQHIAADAGKALEIPNSHRVVIVNCRPMCGKNPAMTGKPR
jgi:hypothetical protein